MVSLGHVFPFQGRRERTWFPVTPRTAIVLVILDFLIDWLFEKLTNKKEVLLLLLIILAKGEKCSLYIRSAPPLKERICTFETYAL